MSSASPGSTNGARALVQDDLERVIAIDREHSGRSRRRFFEKRFAAAARRPEDFIQIGIARGGALRGFAVGHILRGEFGRTGAAAVLDAVGVEPQSQELGIGQALMDALTRTLREREVTVLHSQADWSNHDLMRFFSTSGFRLADRMALERSVAEPLFEATEDV